jgi:hypothetical protein
MLEFSEEALPFELAATRTYIQRRFDQPMDYFGPLWPGVSMVLIHN